MSDDRMQHEPFTRHDSDAFDVRRRKKKKKHKKPQKMTRASVVAMSVFAAPFLLWGVWSAYYLFATWREYSQMQSWVEVPAMIEQVDKESHHQSRGIGKTKGSSSTMYKVAATYSYIVAGQTYKGERVSLYTGTDGDLHYHHAVFHELKQHADAKRAVPAFVNPSDPREAVLYRDWRWKVSGLHAAHAVLFGGLGAFLIGSALYYYCKQNVRS